MVGSSIMTGVFLQARIDSSRLPRKALIELAGMTVIEHAMAALRTIPADRFALLTDDASAPELGPPAERAGFTLFVGPRDDVLRRYVLAAERYDVDRIVRATGDNPLVSGELAVRLLGGHESEGADFSGYLGPPLGTGVEIVETAALAAADREAVDPYEREHVSPFVYRRPERFLIRRPAAPRKFNSPASRVTLDTPEDRRRLEIIFNALYRGTPIGTDLLVAWLAKNEKAMEKELRTGEPNPLHTVGTAR